MNSLINYLGKKIENYFRDGKQLNVKIKYIKENKPLGTAGSLSLLKNKLENKNLIIINGDIFTKINFYNLLKFHENNHNDITICSRYYNYTVPYGVINLKYKLLTNKSIVIEKPTYKFQISAGIYVFKRELLKNLNKNKYLDMNILLNLFSKNKKIGIFPVHEELIDVGDYQSYENANLSFLNDK